MFNLATTSSIPMKGFFTGGVMYEPKIGDVVAHRYGEENYIFRVRGVSLQGGEYRIRLGYLRSCHPYWVDASVYRKATKYEVTHNRRMTRDEIKEYNRLRELKNKSTIEVY